MVYNEDIYYESVERYQKKLHTAARCLAQINYLNQIGVPEGSVIYSEPRKTYKKKNGAESRYHYTNEILYIGGERHYVKKKHAYPNSVAPDVANNAQNPDGHRALCERLLLRMQIKDELKKAKKDAERACKHVNAGKSKDHPRLDYKQELEAACADYLRSDEYQHVIGKIERQIGGDYGPIIESAADELKYCCFSNEIYSNIDERVRSKNELIMVKCIQECGLNYEMEPFYPGTTKRADFKLYRGDKILYLELLGRMDDEAYRTRFREKMELAKCHRIPLVAVDMTDYPGRDKRPVTRLHYDKLRRILQKLSIGILPEKIVRAY